MVLKHIYSGNDLQNFVGISQVLYEILQKHFGLLFFLDTVYFAYDGI